MDIITIDFETYFDKDYSLSKLSTEAYVRDPRFEVHGLAIRYGNGSAHWIDTPRQAHCIFGNSALLCHHAQFDGLILAHHYGIKPKVWLDTLSMSRLLLGNHVKHSLDGIRTHMGMPAKRTPYDLFKGKHWSELGKDVQDAIAVGALDEVESVYAIFCRFMAGDY